MKNNKGITLTSLVIYIALIFVILAILMRITTYFINNLTDAADVSFETEFNKINLYLLDESNQTGNEIVSCGETQITFSNGNRYAYNAKDQTINLNGNIKVCENLESCSFEQKIAPNGKSMLELTVTIDGTTKTVEYIMISDKSEQVINESDYTWNTLEDISNVATE